MSAVATARPVERAGRRAVRVVMVFVAVMLLAALVVAGHAAFSTASRSDRPAPSARVTQDLAKLCHVSGPC